MERTQTSVITEVSGLVHSLYLARQAELEAMAERLDALARDSDDVASWHLAVARDILESHLLALWHLEEAGVNAQQCELVLERAIKGAGDELRQLLAAQTS